MIVALNQRLWMVSITFLGLWVAAVPAIAGDMVTPGQLEAELPTLHCLGYRWLFSGDDNANAVVNVSYRTVGQDDWRDAMPLRRVEVAAMEDRRPPDGQGLFAGSLFFLTPDTDYEVKLVLSDPDSGGTTETVQQRTWKEPIPPPPLRVLHVVPGNGGGSGSATDPFQGLAAVADSTQPGDLVLVHAGVYRGTLSIPRSGTAEAPIVWRSAGDGEAVIEGPQGGPMNEARDIGITMYGARHVFFEKLTFRNMHWAFHASNSSYITVRRCRFEGVAYGYFADAHQERLFLCDNEMVGTESWPKAKGGKRFENRAIDVSGVGHVICYNRIQGFGDGINVRPAYPVRGIDIHNNDISECIDDAIELDFSEHNTRAYLNRITNVSMGVSFQPCRGGPAYVVRNVLYNVGHETWKLHLTPRNPKPNWTTGPHRTSGGVIIHNTVVKAKPPFRVWSEEGPANNFLFRNNLYLGTGSNAIEVTCPLNDLDSDFNAYAAGDGQPWRAFAWLSGNTYPTIQDLAQREGQEEHGLSLAGWEELFALTPTLPFHETRYAPPDLRLASDSLVIDRGEPLPNVSHGFTGQAPDLGAYEFGTRQPHYGIRPERQRTDKPDGP